MKLLTIDGLPIALTSVRIGRFADGFSYLGLLRFSATCPNLTEEEFKQVCEELHNRGYLVRSWEWKSNPLTMDGKKSYKLQARVDPKAELTYKFGDYLVKIKGDVLDRVIVKDLTIEGNKS